MYGLRRQGVETRSGTWSDPGATPSPYKPTAALPFSRWPRRLAGALGRHPEIHDDR
mgnify:CR=1 FL=1